MARTEIVKLRVTPEEKAELKERARDSSVSDFVRGLIWPGEAAGSVSDSDREAFIAERVKVHRRTCPPKLARIKAEEDWEVRDG